MFNAILTGIISAAVLFILVAFTLILLYRKVKRQIIDVILPEKPGEASPLAKVCDSVAAIFAGRIAAHLKAVFLGLQSVESKSDRRAAAQAVIQGNSLLGVVAQAFPAVGKKLMKNPALAGLASLAVNRVATSGGGQSQPVEPASTAQSGFDNF